eukprot:Ihof_evm23s39 gene=Ihof_evmTU23s39
MGDAGFFRGTSADQDVRFSNKEKKLLQQLKSKFPTEFETSVNLSKVNLDVIKPWITDRVTELLGIEDEVVIDFIFNMLETDKHPDPRKMQINLTGFLESKTKVFMKELWCLFISAQKSPHGIPEQFLDKKKEELKKKKEEEQRISSELQRKQTAEVVDEVKRKMLQSQIMANANATLSGQNITQTGSTVHTPTNPLMEALEEHKKQRHNDNKDTSDNESDRNDERSRRRTRDRHHSGKHRSRSRDRSHTPTQSQLRSPRVDRDSKRSSRTRSPSRHHKSRHHISRSRDHSRSPRRSSHKHRRHHHSRSKSRSPSRSNRRSEYKERESKKESVKNSGVSDVKDSAVPSRWERDESPAK